MKISSSKILLTSSMILIGLYILAFTWFPYGYVGTTKKNNGTKGCICHGSNPTPNVNVVITGPDSVAVGQTATFTVTVSNGPAVVGGFNLSSQFGRLDTINGAGTKRDSVSGELTHWKPKAFVSNSVSWNVTYTAPNSPVRDTLFATGNSTNNDTTSDNDQWNWSSNKNIRVYNPIGIINISTIAKEYSISQNYPNPFNPATQFNFSIATSSDVTIKVYDILGNEVSILVNEKMHQGEYKVDFNAVHLASGTYFYSLFVNGKKISTKKMLLVK